MMVVGTVIILTGEVFMGCLFLLMCDFALCLIRRASKPVAVFYGGDRTYGIAGPLDGGLW